MNIQTVKHWLLNLSPWTLCAHSKFKEGDIVRLEDGNRAMKVICVFKERGMVRPLIFCEWNEVHPPQRRKNLFNEDRLKLMLGNKRFI